MFKWPAYPDAPLGHSTQRDFMQDGGKMEPQTDTLQLGASAVAVTLTAYKTTLLSSTAGAEFNLPDGEFIGQRKLLIADVTGSGTAVPSAAALAKLRKGGHVTGNAANLTGLTFDADGEYALLEWDGTRWNAFYATATVAP